MEMPSKSCKLNTILFSCLLAVLSSGYLQYSEVAITHVDLWFIGTSAIWIGLPSDRETGLPCFEILRR